jgi:hypothetical protein
LEHIEEKPVFPNIEPSTLTQLFAEPLPWHWIIPSGLSAWVISGIAMLLAHPREQRLWTSGYTARRIFSSPC